MFHSSGNSCLSTSITEEIETKDNQACGIILPSHPSEAGDSLSSGHVTSKEPDPPKLPWPKSPESCSSVAETNSVLTEGEESDVESRRSGLELGEIPAISSGERNGLELPGVCGNVCFYYIYCVVRVLSGRPCCASKSCYRVEITFHINRSESYFF